MTLIEIGIPQISGGCPYKVVNSQWVPTRPEAMTKNEQMNVSTLHVRSDENNLLALSQEENSSGRFLKAHSQQDKTRAGKMMAAVGKSLSFSSQQRYLDTCIDIYVK